MKLGDHVESVADGLHKIIESVQDSVNQMGMGFTFIALEIGYLWAAKLQGLLKT